MSSPEFVAVLRDHQWQRLPRDSVSPGATIRVATGEAIAFDSRVISGTSVIDEAVFTGESLPRSVQKDDVVFAGTVNEGASLELIVEHRFSDSRLAALAHDIDRARGREACPPTADRPICSTVYKHCAPGGRHYLCRLGGI